jgi:hypothetical protein
MGRTACTEPQCLCKGAPYLFYLFYRFNSQLYCYVKTLTKKVNTVPENIENPVSKSTKCLKYLKKKSFRN